MALEYYIQGGGTFQPATPDDASDNELESKWICQGTTPPDPPPDPIIANAEGEREFLYGRYWCIAPYKFPNANFGNDTNPVPIGNKVRLGIRYYSNETIIDDPDNPGCREVSRTYADWELISQTITVATEGAPADRKLYNNLQTNEEGLETLSPGVYQSGGITLATANYSYCGVKSDVDLSYYGPFNEGDISYIPRLVPSNQGAIRASIPNSPYDPNHDPPIFPLNALTGYSPDSRTEVKMTYTITTTYRAGNLQATDSVNVTQTAFKTVNLDYADLIKTTVAQSYFEYNIQNMFLWDVDEPAFYEEDGTPIPPLQRYNERTGETYDLTTNGAGFVGLSKEQDTPPPNPNPDELEYTIVSEVATVDDLPIYSFAGNVYKVIEGDQLYISDGDYPISNYYNITEDED